MRTIQDYHVRYALTAAKGVAEVASIGGFIKEYQVDIDPHAMKAHGVNVSQIMALNLTVLNTWYVRLVTSKILRILKKA